jgi:hypothetical protein
MHRAKRGVRSRRVPKSHLAVGSNFGESGAAAEMRDSEMLDAILASCQYLHAKLDRILGYTEGDGEEEDETDG